MNALRTTGATGRMLSVVCLGVMGIAPVAATTMKASDDASGQHKLMFGCVTDPVQSTPKRSSALRTNEPVRQPIARTAQLNIGSSTTWVVEGGDPLMVTYCVAPAVQSTGNTPWTLAVELKLVDIRTVDHPNEDPNASQVFTPKPATGPLQSSTHQKANFPPVQVQLPVIPGPWVAVPVVPTNGWCKTVAWYQRPDLQIQATGRGVSAYCPVQFTSPLSRIKPNKPPKE